MVAIRRTDPNEILYRVSDYLVQIPSESGADHLGGHEDPERVPDETGPSSILRIGFSGWDYIFRMATFGYDLGINFRTLLVNSSAARVLWRTFTDPTLITTSPRSLLRQCRLGLCPSRSVFTNLIGPIQITGKVQYALTLQMIFGPL